MQSAKLNEIEQLKAMESSYLISDQQRKRCSALRLKLEGYTYKQISDHLNVSLGSISSWVKSYNEQGIEGLLSRGKPGPALSGGRIEARTVYESDNLSAKTLAEQLNVSERTAYRAIDNTAVPFYRGSFFVPASFQTNSLFIDIVGLYIYEGNLAFVTKCGQYDNEWKKSGKLYVFRESIYNVLVNDIKGLEDEYTLADGIKFLIDNPYTPHTKFRSFDIKAFLQLCEGAARTSITDEFTLIYTTSRHSKDFEDLRITKKFYKHTSSWCHMLAMIMVLTRCDNKTITTYMDILTSIANNPIQGLPLQWICSYNK